MAKKLYYDVVTELDDSGFVDCKDEGDLQRNLWSMFKMRYTGEELELFHQRFAQEPFGACVSDYAWTQDVEKAFYEHPKNKKVFKRLKRKKQFGFFALQCEPATLSDEYECVRINGELNNGI